MVVRPKDIEKKKPISVKPLLDIIDMRQGDFDIRIYADDGEKAVGLFMNVFFKIKAFFKENDAKNINHLPNMEINADGIASVVIKNISPIKKLLPVIIEIAFRYTPEINIEHPLSLDYWVLDKNLDKVHFYDFSTDEQS